MKRKDMATYRSDINNLRARCKKAGINVRFVNGKLLRDYAGFNDEASKKLGFHKLPDDTILIDRDMPLKTQYKNLLHEIEEMIRMEKLGSSYWNAHLAALKAEDKGLSDFVLKKMEKGV